MVDIVLTWDLKKDLEFAKKLANSNTEVLREWYGKENYERLLENYPQGGSTTADNWIKDCFIDSIDNIILLIQTTADETQDNPLVQKRLKAVGFNPRNT